MNQVLVLALLAALMQSGSGRICGDWKEAVRIGELSSPVDEASGVAVSRRFPGRVYHVNDSGDTGRFFVSGIDGRNTRIVDIDGFKPQDVEAISIGPCGENTSCLFVADIGNNSGRNRDAIDIIVIEETEDMPRRIRPKHRIRMRYPRGGYDAEGLAVHPDGTIFVLTKSRSPQLFSLPRSEWESGSSRTHVMHPVRTLKTDGLPTDLSISDDGSHFLVLTYTGAIEFDRDFNSHTIPLRFLEQQEAVSYLPGSRSFIYTTERFGNLPAWIMRSDFLACEW